MGNYIPLWSFPQSCPVMRDSKFHVEDNGQGTSSVSLEQ